MSKPKKPARTARAKKCSRAGHNLTTKPSTRAGRALADCRSKAKPTSAGKKPARKPKPKMSRAARCSSAAWEVSVIGSSRGGRALSDCAKGAARRSNPSDRTLRAPDMDAYRKARYAIHVEHIRDDEEMKAIARAVYGLSEGVYGADSHNLQLDLRFESMDDLALAYRLLMREMNRAGWMISWSAIDLRTRRSVLDELTGHKPSGGSDDSAAYDPLRQAGTAVQFAPSKASLALYSRPPKVGARGITAEMPGAHGAAFLDGPGGGLVYVAWLDEAPRSVSPQDLKVVSMPKVLQSTPGWLSSGEMTTHSNLPDAQVKTVRKGDRYFPVRGGGYQLGVQRGGKTVGWISVNRLGFDSAKSWMAAVKASTRSNPHRDEDGELVEACSYCGSGNTKSAGVEHGRPAFRCLDCGQTFRVFERAEPTRAGYAVAGRRR